MGWTDQGSESPPSSLAFRFRCSPPLPFLPSLPASETRLRSVLFYLDVVLPCLTLPWLSRSLPPPPGSASPLLSRLPLARPPFSLTQLATKPKLDIRHLAGSRRGASFASPFPPLSFPPLSNPFSFALPCPALPLHSPFTSQQSLPPALQVPSSSRGGERGERRGVEWSGVA